MYFIRDQTLSENYRANVAKRIQNKDLLLQRLHMKKLRYTESVAAEANSVILSARKRL
jgi:hypothetical protein